jgi:hypothetical protein
MIITFEKGGSTKEIEFDAVVRETHSTGAQVTDHFVEKGINVADHVRPNAERLAVEAMVTNTPITPKSTHMRGAEMTEQAKTITVEEHQKAGGVDIKIQRSYSARVLQSSAQFDRVRDIYADIKDIVDNSRVVSVRATVGGGLRDYDNMILTSLTNPRDASSGSGQAFNFEVVKLRTVETRKVNAPAPKQRKQRGKKSKKEAKPDDKKGKKVGLVKDLLNEAGVF